MCERLYYRQASGENRPNRIGVNAKGVPISSAEIASDAQDMLKIPCQSRVPTMSVKGRLNIALLFRPSLAQNRAKLSCLHGNVVGCVGRRNCQKQQAFAKR